MEQNEKKPLIILTGPTAVGKTELSIELAKAVNGEILSADSMQVYRGMDIGTAKIKKEEMQGIPHYMIDELDPDEEFNVYIFQEKIRRYMTDIYNRGKIPILTGGTGFYIQAILYDIAFTQTPSDPSYRLSLQRQADEQGVQALYERLKEVDPVYAATLHANNVKRVIRALEFYKLNGYPISEHNEKEAAKTSPYNFAYFVLNHKRDILYDRINRRVDIMAEQGLIDEVKRLKEEGYEKTMVSMQGIGYRQVFEYLEGNLSLEDTIEQIKKDTRHFAKRQLTWFGREKEVCMVDKSQFGSEDEILTYMLTILKEKGIYDGSVKELL